MAPSPVSAPMGTFPQPDAGALSGLLVLDFGQAAVGPVSASYLGMLGATVIKVEQPSGDSVRRGQPTMRGTSTTFVGNNLTKFGIALDLKHPEGLADVKRIIAKADVLIENFRSPSIMERLGLGYESVLAALNPRLVYVQSSAFGPRGPWTGMYSDEWMAESVSGCVSLTGATGAPGEFTRGSALLDWNGAMLNTVACLAALTQRDRTGRGQMVRTSQFGSSIFSGLTRLAELNASGRTALPRGSGTEWLVPDQAFRTTDGFVYVSVPSEKFWPRFCEAISRPELACDSRFRANRERLEHREALMVELLPTFLSRPVREWVERLRAADVPCAPDNRGESLTGPQLRHEQIAANGMLTHIDSGYGQVLTQSPHWKFEKTPAAISRPSPQFGEHTRQVLEAISDWRPLRPKQESKVNGSAEGCLAGLQVVEFASGVPGPLAGMVLTQLGATVLRVEPPEGDWLSHTEPLQEGVGAVYRMLNAGKPAAEADLTTVAGRQSVRQHIADADVILVGFREHKLERLGIAYEQIQALNPRAVYCHVGGWGNRGTERDAAVTELMVQAVAGVPRYLGKPDAEPIRLGFDVASTSTGLAAVQAILAALLWRNTSGEGQRVDVNMLASTIAVNQWSTVAESGTDKIAGRQLEGPSWPPDHGFASSSGRCLIGFRDKSKWRHFAVALGRADLLTDERFIAEIEKHPPLIAPRLEQNLHAWSMAALERLVRDELGGTIVPILDLPGMLGHAQTHALELLSRESSTFSMRLPMDGSAGLLKEKRDGHG